MRISGCRRGRAQAARAGTGLEGGTGGEGGHRRRGRVCREYRDDDDFGGAGGVWYGAEISDAVIDVGDPWGLRDAEWAIADVPYGFW